VGSKLVPPPPNENLQQAPSMKLQVEKSACSASPASIPHISTRVESGPLGSFLVSSMVEAQKDALDFRPDACGVSQELSIRFQLCACPTGRNIIGCYFFFNNNLLNWIRACYSYTASHQGRLWIFFIATVICLHRTRTTTCSSHSSVFPSGHYFSAFGEAGPWSLYVGGRWTFESASNVAFCWFRFFLCFVWETHIAGGSFRFGIRIGILVLVGDINTPNELEFVQ
jgi:hypothetical protein